MGSRANSIDILTKRVVDPRSQDFSTLYAPCRLYDLISPFDIEVMRKTATSAKLAAKPKEKYAIIKDIMEARGFKKLASGTNRVVFKYGEDQRIVVKVAYDSVGMSDNPREFRNQIYLQPFVTKIFEVSPCGTVALCERVRTITNTAEFMSVAEYVYDVITHFVYTKGYVLDDFGSNFFMNWGVCNRGPVLLDYPYMHELDGNKLYCNKPDPQELSGFCGGEIDYDYGFNHLVCQKCGKMFLATDLKKDPDKQALIISKRTGGNKMKVRLLVDNEVVVEKDNSKRPATTYGRPERKNNNNYQNNRRQSKSKYSSRDEENKTVYTTEKSILKPRLVYSDDVNVDDKVVDTFQEQQKVAETNTDQFNNNTTVDTVEEVDKMYKNTELTAEVEVTDENLERITPEEDDIIEPDVQDEEDDESEPEDTEEESYEDEDDEEESEEEQEPDKYAEAKSVVLIVDDIEDNSTEEVSEGVTDEY